jgi:hypothetical protein
MLALATGGRDGQSAMGSPVIVLLLLRGSSFGDDGVQTVQVSRRADA